MLLLLPPGGIAIRRVCMLVGWFVRRSEAGGRTINWSCGYLAEIALFLVVIVVAVVVVIIINKTYRIQFILQNLQKLL